MQDIAREVAVALRSVVREPQVGGDVCARDQQRSAGIGKVSQHRLEPGGECLESISRHAAPHGGRALLAEYKIDDTVTRQVALPRCDGIEARRGERVSGLHYRPAVQCRVVERISGDDLRLVIVVTGTEGVVVVIGAREGAVEIMLFADERYVANVGRTAVVAVVESGQRVALNTHGSCDALETVDDHYAPFLRYKAAGG